METQGSIGDLLDLHTWVCSHLSELLHIFPECCELPGLAHLHSKAARDIAAERRGLQEECLFGNLPPFHGGDAHRVQFHL